MINIKIFKKAKSSSPETRGGITTPGSSISSDIAKEALHALRADYAVEAERANSALQADNALHADEATEADHAKSAYDLDKDSPVNLRFLSKLVADVAKGHITFAEGLTSLKAALLRGGVQIGEYVKGLFNGKGAAVDADGNAEFQSLSVRSWLKVQELIYNRLNAIEGETSFSDSGTIDRISLNSDGTINAEMRKRWDGDFTAFQPGDIVYGYINNLDKGDVKEFCQSWCWVKSIDRSANSLTLALYPDTETPAGANFAPTEGMIIARRGNNIAPNAASFSNPDYSAFIVRSGEKYINTRQRSFYISCDDGNIIELIGVNRPILERGNYGTVLGVIPQGLLSPEITEILNAEQPYLYARGIIVQDLIRIGYEGLPTPTANYRGKWSADIAADESKYYRTTPGMYDTVTWEGSLWQCVVTGTTDMPGDSSAAWVRMTGGDDGPRVWVINPSAQLITVHTDGTATPETVSASVTLNTQAGTRLLQTPEEFNEEGVRLYYTTDGAIYKPFDVGAFSPLELESGAGLITLEDGSPINVGGDDMNTADIADSGITFNLIEVATGALLATAGVSVVRDGEQGTPGKDGIPGRDGLLVYPAGIFDSLVTYTSTNDTTPVVLYNEHYYVLNPGHNYTGSQEPLTHNTPALDVANSSGAAARWRLMDKFRSVFADILMADFAKLSSAVFYGDWMISQQGAINGEDSNQYQDFKTGDFIPNFSVNFRTGEINAKSGTFEGALYSRFKSLTESDAAYTANGEWRLNNDLKIIDNAYDMYNVPGRLVLPNGADCIGKRILVCNPIVFYAKDVDQSTTIRTDGGGSLILGYPVEDGAPEAERYTCTGVSFLTGAIELVAIPSQLNSDVCNWLILSLSAYKTNAQYISPL